MGGRQEFTFRALKFCKSGEMVVVWPESLLIKHDVESVFKSAVVQ